MPRVTKTRPTMSVPKKSTVFLRSAAALILPAGIAALWLTGPLRIIVELLGERVVTVWIGVTAGVLLLLLECRWLVTLAQLAWAWGDYDLYQARQVDPQTMRRRRRRRLGSTAALLATMLGLSLAELTFRAFHIVPPPPPPSVEEEWNAFDKSVNVLGIREVWDSLPENDHRVRIAFLGDSITFGDNVQPEETFCHLVEGRLARVLPGGVVTINMGYRGTDPAWQLRKYLPLGDRLRPDVVVHVLYPNDLGLRMRPLLDDIYRTRDDKLWCGDFSYLLRFVERQIRYRLAWRRTIDYFRGGRDAKQRELAWQQLRTDVRRCQQAVEEDGAIYALVLFPWLVRLDHYLLTHEHDEMGRFAEELDVPYLDLLDVMSRYEARAVRVSVANEHPNALGHRIAADRLARFIEEDVLPARLRSSARTTIP